MGRQCCWGPASPRSCICCTDCRRRQHARLENNSCRCLPAVSRVFTPAQVWDKWTLVRHCQRQGLSQDCSPCSAPQAQPGSQVWPARLAHRTWPSLLGLIDTGKQSTWPPTAGAAPRTWCLTCGAYPSQMRTLCRRTPAQTVALLPAGSAADADSRHGRQGGVGSAGMVPATLELLVPHHCNFSAQPELTGCRVGANGAQGAKVLAMYHMFVLHTSRRHEDCDT